jgi:tetratricopeptide (TPR) repeat protein
VHGHREWPRARRRPGRPRGRRDLALKISYIPGAGRGSANAGLIHEDKGNYEKAFEFYKNALKYDDEFGDKLRYAVDNANIARVLWKMGRLEEALSLINETIALSRILGYKIHTAWQLVVKAEILFDLKRYKEAWEVNEEGQLLAIETSLSQRILQSQELSARLEIVFGKPEAARIRLNKMLEADPDIFTVASVHYLFWQMTKDEDDAKQAMAYYREAYAQEPYIEWERRLDELTQAVN